MMVNSCWNSCIMKILFSTAWKTLEMPQTIYGIHFILTWSTKCAISPAVGATKFAIADTKLWIPVLM